MSMFPHTITVYNVQREVDKTTFEETVTNYITVLKGVLLDESKGSNVRESGLVGADSANLYIPIDVDASDGVTGEPKRYVGPMEFWSAEDKSELWSFTTHGDGGDTFFVRGEVVEPNMEIEKIELLHDGVYTVTKCDFKDYGGLQHWEVGGA